MNEYEEVIYSLIYNSLREVTKEEEQILNQASAIYNTYNQLTEQLSCPLDVVFKAREGFYTNVGYISPEHIYNIDIKHQTIEFEWLTEDGYWDEEGIVEFENYKKNWWLKEDKSE